MACSVCGDEGGTGICPTCAALGYTEVVNDDGSMEIIREARDLADAVWPAIEHPLDIVAVFICEPDNKNEDDDEDSECPF